MLQITAEFNRQDGFKTYMSWGISQDNARRDYNRIVAEWAKRSDYVSYDDTLCISYMRDVKTGSEITLSLETIDGDIQRR